MIASLPMYDTPHTRAANDRLWQSIRSHLGEGPETLDRDTDPHETWVRSDLVLSQTCGLPFRTELSGKVGLVGTPDYGVPGCPAGYYCSCIVVRSDDPRNSLADYQDAILARNDARSQSGWAAIVQHLSDAGLKVPSTIIETGAHRASAEAVADGKADFATLDAVTWELLKHETDLASRLRVFDYTIPTPGLPFITAKERDSQLLFDAVSKAIENLSESDRQTLMLRQLVRIPASTYGSITTDLTVF